MRIATERRGGFLPTAYAYNLRSWVTHINSPLFSQRLSYGEPSDGGQPRYGGGVSAMDWQAAGDSVRSYRYQYDGLGRLTSADYLESGHSSDRYVTEYSYDLMGNILTLSRSGKVYDEIYGVTDDLTYQYDGNRLIRVTNHAADTPAYKDAMYYADGADLDTERTYDANGNMTSNADSRISRISYDALNMPCRIDYIDGSHIDYTYAADSVKQRVDYYLNPYTSSLPDDDLGTACDSSLLVHTWREYAGNCIYVCDTLSMILIDGGYITFDYATHQPIYHYYLKDYLGNNRITVSLADGRIEEVNHYYPFGGLMGDSRNATTQPYKYIGKELDRTHGLNWYDHGARHYDPVTGRWNVMDALAEKYYPWSPYVSCGDDPVNYIDASGDSAWAVRRQWSEEDSENFSKYAQDRLMYYYENGIKIDCADLALSVLIDYASENGLPLQLTSASGEIFDSMSDKYNTTSEFKNGNQKARGALALGARDISANTSIIEKTLSRPGDLIILDRPSYHIVNILSKKPPRLIYGNLENGRAKKVEITRDWSHSTIGGLRYKPDTKHVHRWIFFK